MEFFKTFFLAPLILYPLYFFGFFYFLLYFLLFVHLAVYRSMGIRRPPGEHVRLKRKSLLRSFLWDFPRQWAYDVATRPPDFFRYQGCIIFTGRQGNGKTIAMAQQAMAWQKEYPSAKVLTNFALTTQDAELSDWRQLIDFKNGIQGVICCMDEMQNWFSSNQSRNFPPEMLEVITQNRKNRRVIMGTAQSFNRLAKPIREQATQVRRCVTLFGCITFVHQVEPDMDADGNVLKWKHRGLYYFVHTPELRNAYDTWRVVEALKDSGFKDPAPAQTTTVRVTVPAPKKK